MRNQELKDNVLVANYMKGNEKSLEVLIERHKQRIFGYIYSKVLDRSLADDIFQDTFVKIINNLKMGKYNEEGKFLSWALRVSHNLIMDHFRKERRRPVLKNSEEFDFFSVISDTTLNAEKQAIKNQIHDDVRKIVNTLPQEQKEVLVMRLYNNMSFKEIANNSGTSINTSLGRMRYALVNMRKIINEHNISLTN